LPSSEHAAPLASKRQDEEQQSPSTVFPSSHCSPASSRLLPQRLPTKVPLTGNAPRQSKRPVKDVPSAATVPAIVRVEQ